MANTNAYNVYRIDTTADFPQIDKVKYITVVPSGSAVITIKKENTSGATVWEYAGTARLNEDVCIEAASKGLRVEVSNAVVYLYV